MGSAYCELCVIARPNPVAPTPQDPTPSPLESVRALKPKDLTGYEVIFLGSPCHSADVAKPVKKLLEKMETSPGARLAGFVTHSTYTPEGGERQRKLHEQWAGKCAGTFEQACATKGLVWSGYFGCQGAPSKPIEIFIRHAAIKDPNEWPAYSREPEAPRRPRRSPRASLCA